MPSVWAIGEVASFEGRCTGLVAPANAMAEVVADRLLGGAAEFTTVDDATKLKLAGGTRGTVEVLTRELRDALR